MEAYVAGLEQAADNGHDLSAIHSVASFFVSRVDTEIDKRLEGIDEDVTALRGQAASPTPAWPTRTSRSSSAASAGSASPRTAPTSSARCGPPPA